MAISPSHYVALSLGLHVLWEAMQLPLYTIWTTSTVAGKVYAAVHCAIGDVVIASLALLLALVVTGSAAWPVQRSREVFTLTLALGLIYTVYSEWLNRSVKQSWTYSSLMPVLPPFGTGLSPVVQGWSYLRLRSLSRRNDVPCDCEYAGVMFSWEDISYIGRRWDHDRANVSRAVVDDCGHGLC